MTTKNSPLRVLKTQADNIAQKLKAFERGERADVRFAEKLDAARGKESLIFGIMMDDKLIQVTMPWTLIHETSEVGLAEYILKQMRESREVAH